VKITYTPVKISRRTLEIRQENVKWMSEQLRSEGLVSETLLSNLV